MKVLVPLNGVEHSKEYMESGAEEFYTGFYEEEWNKLFGPYADINRMSGYKKDANVYTLDELIDQIPKIRAAGATLFVTFNAGMYSEEQLELVRKYMMRLASCGVDGVIVSSIELVKLAVECGLKVVVSTIAGVYNSDIARFYQELGARRIILPRDLSIEEIKSIVENVPEIEYEVFMMRNGCHFSDSNCLGFHRKTYSSFCSGVCNADIHMLMKQEEFHEKHNAQLTNMLYNHSYHSYACGLCAIYDFVKLGIAAGKIVGRSDDWMAICEDIKLVQENVQLAMECSSKEEYLEKMRFPANEAEMCKLGFSCYYPEIRY